MKAFAFVSVLGLAALCGCAATPVSVPCSATSTYSFGIGAPSGGTLVADHAAAAPGNQVQLYATSTPTNSNPQCAVPTVVARVYATWTTSDTMDVQVSSAQDTTNGLVTCTGTTLTPATITATYTSGSMSKSASTQLTCK